MRRTVVAPLGLFLIAIPGWGQAIDGELNPFGNPNGGLRITRVSLFSGYSSSAMPPGSAFPAGAVPLGSDIVMGSEISMRWLSTGPNGSVVFTYDPSYTALAGHPEWNSMGHTLSFSASRKLTPRLTLGLALNGAAASSNQLLFTPTVMANIAATDATFDELASAMLGGTLTNSELAAALTGAPLLESPARTLLYGNRVLTSSASVSMAYASSTRMSFHFSASGGRSQYLADGEDPANARYRTLIPRTTSANAEAGFTYALSPRTNIGVETSATRGFSLYQDAYDITGRLTAGRKMGERWLVSGYVGAAKLLPVRETLTLTTRPQYVTGGSIGVRTHAQTLVASVDRSAADAYALGAGHTLSATGAWSWRRPGSGWAFSTSGGWERLGGTSALNVEGWTLGAQVSRRVSRKTSVHLSYAYMSDSGQFVSALQELSMQAVRLEFVWEPARGR